MRRKSQREELDDMMVRPIPKKKIGIVHLEMVKESRSLYGTSRFHSAEELVKMIRPLYERAHREMVLVLALNTQLEIQALEIAAVGTLNACYVDMREIFKLAIISNSAHIVCMHNHPSGDSEPSYEDKKLTERLKHAGTILGVSLVDHIIVGESGFYSFRNGGDLSEW